MFSVFKFLLGYQHIGVASLFETLYVTTFHTIALPITSVIYDTINMSSCLGIVANGRVANVNGNVNSFNANVNSCNSMQMGIVVNGDCISTLKIRDTPSTAGFRISR